MGALSFPQSGILQEELSAARNKTQVNAIITLDDLVWVATDTLVQIYQRKKKDKVGSALRFFLVEEG